MGRWEREALFGKQANRLAHCIGVAALCTGSDGCVEKLNVAGWKRQERGVGCREERGIIQGERGGRGGGGGLLGKFTSKRTLKFIISKGGGRRA